MFLYSSSPYHTICSWRGSKYGRECTAQLPRVERR